MEAGLVGNDVRTHRPIRVGQFHGSGDIWK